MCIMDEVEHPALKTGECACVDINSAFSGSEKSELYTSQYFLAPKNVEIISYHTSQRLNFQ